MKIKFTLLLTIIIVALTFSECKKYEEGPRISFRSKEKRVEGEWDVSTFTINGENQLLQTFSGYHNCASGGQAYYNETNTITRYVWTFEKDTWNSAQTEDRKILDQFTTYNNCSAFYSYTTNTYAENGTWEFISKKEKIEIIFPSNDVMIFSIIELKEKEMKLEGNDSSGETWKMTFTKR